MNWFQSFCYDSCFDHLFCYIFVPCIHRFPYPHSFVRATCQWVWIHKDFACSLWFNYKITTNSIYHFSFKYFVRSSDVCWSSLINSAWFISLTASRSQRIFVFQENLYSWSKDQFIARIEIKACWMREIKLEWSLSFFKACFLTIRRSYLKTMFSKEFSWYWNVEISWEIASKTISACMGS